MGLVVTMTVIMMTEGPLYAMLDTSSTIRKQARDRDPCYGEEARSQTGVMAFLGKTPIGHGEPVDNGGRMHRSSKGCGLDGAVALGAQHQ